MGCNVTIGTTFSAECDTFIPHNQRRQVYNGPCLVKFFAAIRK